jgi:hypothetical protein
LLVLVVLDDLGVDYIVVVASAAEPRSESALRTSADRRPASEGRGIHGLRPSSGTSLSVLTLALMSSTDACRVLGLDGLLEVGERGLDRAT